MKKILVLGGTNFIGRNLVDRLVETGNHDITLFNRGQTNPTLHPGLKRIKGDRNTPTIEQIFNQRWDYIIDLSCFYPNSLEHIVHNLKEEPERYIFISTCSVYDNDQDQSILRNEDAPTLSCSEEERVDTSTATYGKRKAACERILIQSGIPHTIFRPALVYGPHDNTDRFYYWLYQVKKEQALLLPNQGKSTFSVTYVADLVQAIEKSLTATKSSSIYNATTCPQMSIEQLIDTAAQVLNKTTHPHNASSAFLNEAGVSQWTDLPLWLDCDYFTYDNQRLLNELGTQVSNFKDSVSKTVAYYDKLGWQPPKFGMDDPTKLGLIQKLADKSS